MHPKINGRIAKTFNSLPDIISSSPALYHSYCCSPHSLYLSATQKHANESNKLTTHCYSYCTPLIHPHFVSHTHIQANKIVINGLIISSRTLSLSPLSHSSPCSSTFNLFFSFSPTEAATKGAHVPTEGTSAGRDCRCGPGTHQADGVSLKSIPSFSSSPLSRVQCFYSFSTGFIFSPPSILFPFLYLAM